MVRVVALFLLLSALRQTEVAQNVVLFLKNAKTESQSSRYIYKAF